MRPRIKEFDKDNEFALSGVQYDFPLALVAMTRNSLSDNFIAHALRATNAYGLADRVGRVLQGVDDPILNKDQIKQIQDTRPGLSFD